MSSENNKTIESYEVRSGEYIAATVQEIKGPMKNWLDGSVEALPLESQILEIGSGSGRDAEYLQSKGYSVQCSDATQGFIDILKEKGLSPRTLNIITDEIEGEYDAIIANAVLLHLTDEETHHALRKVYDALKPSGRFSFSVKVGEGEAWTDGKLGLPRYFNYWNEASLRALLESVQYQNVIIDTVGKLDDTWLMVRAYK